MKKIIYSFAVLAGLTSATAQTTVFDVISGSPDHTILETALIQEGLDVVLDDATADYTVFAPDDAAFANLLAELGISASDLLASPELDQILLYHVLGAEVLSTSLTNAVFVPTAQGDSVFVSLLTGGAFIDQAQVTAPDLPADNGVVHVVNDVMFPQNSLVDVAVSGGFSILTQAVVTAELAPALIDPLVEYTVFAPTDAAFTNLLGELGITATDLLNDPDLDQILLYHVLGSEVMSTDLSNGVFVPTLQGDSTFVSVLTSGAYIDQAMVSTPDVDADNGVVHVVNDVILPQNSLVDVAVTNGFSILTQAVIAAELAPALIDPLVDYTVFAPTDAAFTALLSELGITATDLLNDPDLDQILLYHVLGSEVFSTDLTNGVFVPTLQGDSTFVSLITAGAYIDQAMVSLPDVDADNGVVHVLDDVILPQNSLVDVAVSNGFTVLTQAVVAAELAPVLTDPLAEYTVFAPTDAAFTAFLAANGLTAADLLASPDLASILLHHVVAGTVMSTDLTNGPVTTANGTDVVVDLSMGVMIDNATVITADVDADNGVVHAIDDVLVLPASSINENELNVSVYPNPFTELIRIEAEGNHSVIIRDAAGRVVLQEVMTNGTINVNDLAKGMYLLNVPSLKLAKTIVKQ